MQEKSKTIYFRDLSWENADEYAKSHGFKDLSPFIEYCTSKEMHLSKIKNAKFLFLLFF